MSSPTWPKRPNGSSELGGADERLAELGGRGGAPAGRGGAAGRGGHRRPRPAPRVTSPMRSAASSRNSACPAPSSRWPSNRRRPRVRGGSSAWNSGSRPGPGRRPAPLAKTASGGELSRTMLACRSVLADLDAIPTLVFDEVDAGIGGQAGLAVGRRLARLAQDRQVLVVTHLPQIACFADRHLSVAKQRGRGTDRGAGRRRANRRTLTHARRHGRKRGRRVPCARNCSTRPTRVKAAV